MVVTALLSLLARDPASAFEAITEQPARSSKPSPSFVRQSTKSKSIPAKMRSGSGRQRDLAQERYCDQNTLSALVSGHLWHGGTGFEEICGTQGLEHENRHPVERLGGRDAEWLVKFGAFAVGHSSRVHLGERIHGLGFDRGDLLAGFVIAFDQNRLPSSTPARSSADAPRAPRPQPRSPRMPRRNSFGIFSLTIRGNR